MSELIITFRESMEAALIVGIVYSYLKNSQNDSYIRFIYYGITIGIVGSIAGAYGFFTLSNGLEGKNEMLYDGIIMSIGAFFIFYFILWMSGQKDMTSTIGKDIKRRLSRSSGIGITMLIAVSILREGIESTLFIGSVVYAKEGISIVMALLGIILGILVGYGVYLGFKGLKLRYLFSSTTFLLAIFAAGLLSHSIHEFQEAGIIPTYIEHLWDINFILNEESGTGKFLKSIIGYNANPSLIETLVYFSSLGIIFSIYRFKPVVRLTKNRSYNLL